MSKLSIRLLFCLLLIALAQPVQAQTNNDHSDTHFETMATYLTKGSGKWTGENQNFDPNNSRSPKAFGLWFERPLKNLLTLKIVAYRNDSTIISSQGTFAWHPDKQQFLHMMVDRGHGYSEGFSEFANDSIFSSIMVVYRPNGKSYHHKDVNYIVDENTHRNTSYSKDENGNWVEKGRWLWTRDPQKKD